MKCRSALIMFSAVIALCAPVCAQSLQGGVILTYDPGTLSITSYAWTALDGSYSDYYTVKVSMYIYREDHAIELSTYSDYTPFFIAISPPDLPAYPGTTYHGIAQHSVSMEMPCDGLWCDPYRIGMLVYTAYSTDYFNQNLPVDEEFITFIEQKDAAETETAVTTPPAGLNVQSGATMLITNGTQSTSASCPTDPKASDNGTSTCTFFVPADANDTPQVPNIQSWLSSINGTLPVRWAVTLNYTRSDARCVPEPKHPYSDSIISGVQTADGSAHFDLRAALGLQNPGHVQGGNVALSWQIGDAPVAPDVLFGLWGLDPHQSSIVNRVNSNSAAPWYSLYIIKWESSYHQFNFQTGFNGTPNYGPVCGFGLSQQDPPGQFGNSKADVVWNWQLNVDDGIQEMVQKQSRGDRQWADAQARWRDDPFPGKQDPPCAKPIGGPTHTVTFCMDITKGRSWSEANGIKCYNSCGRPYLDYDVNTHTWVFSTYVVFEGNQIYYVKHVLDQVVP